MQQIEIKQVQMNPFAAIGDDWMLLSAAHDGKANTMTVSWGGLGIMWGKPVATVYVRPQRYTKEFIDAQDYFTLSLFDGACKDEMGYLGKVSGRDEDKIAKSGLTLVDVNGHPGFAEASKTLVCKKLYADTIKPELFIDEAIDERWYPEKDYHMMYIAEIVEAYEA